MVYKITPKGNYFNPQVESGVVIDDDGNVYLNDVYAENIVQVDPSPVQGTNYSFIAGGGGFGNSAPGTVYGIRNPTAPSEGPIAYTIPISPEAVVDYFAINDVDRFPVTGGPTAPASDVGELSPTSTSFAFSAGHQSQTAGFVTGGAANNVTFPLIGVGLARLDTIEATIANGPANGGGGGGDYIDNQGNNFVQGTQPEATNFVNASGFIDQTNPIADKIYIHRATANPLFGGSLFAGPSASGFYQGPAPELFNPSYKLAGSTLLAVPAKGAGPTFGEPQGYVNTSTKLTRDFGYEWTNPVDPTQDEKDLLRANTSFMFELVPYQGVITDVITSFPFSSPTVSASDVGELSIETVKAGGHSSPTHAYVSGGAIKAFPNPKATFSPYNTDYSEPAYSADVDVNFEVPLAPTSWPYYISGNDLELSFVTDKIQRYPFAISGSASEEVGSLGVVLSRESQIGPASKLSPVSAAVDGRAIYYNRFFHAAASTTEHGYLVGGKIAGVVVNQSGVPTTPREYHYRIMTPGTEPFDFASDRSVPYTPGKRTDPTIDAYHGRVYFDYPDGSIATLGYAPYINHHPKFNPQSYDPASNITNAPDDVIPSTGEPHDEWVSQVNVVNSDIIKFNFSSSSSASAVGQLVRYDTGNRSRSVWDPISVVSGPDAMYVRHTSSATASFFNSKDEKRSLVKYPFSNMAPSVVIDAPSSVERSDETSTQSATDGYFSGGSNRLYLGSILASPGTPSEFKYLTDIEKFPFSSFASASNVGDLTKFRDGSAVGIND